MPSNKAQFNPRHLYFNALGEMIQKIAKEQNIHYSDVTASVHMSNRTYHRLLTGQDMHLNYYLRLFHYLSTYFPTAQAFWEYVMEFMKKALSGICSLMGVEEEWGGERAVFSI